VPHYNNILVRGVNRLGDTLFALPAIKSLKIKYPDARLTVLTKPLPVDLYKHNPCVDNIIMFDGKESHRSLGGRLNLVKMLRKEGFDLAVLLHNNFESALTVFLAGIPERIGYPKELRSFLLTKSLPFPKTPTPRVDHFLAITKLVGCDDRDKRPDLYISSSEKEWAVTRLKTIPRPIVGIIPGAQEKTRIWGSERFSAVADGLINEAKASILILGGPGDKKLSLDIRTRMKNSPYDMTGEFSLREFMGILSSCDLVISNDTGPMHIANLLGTEVITFFGAGDLIETRPVGPNAHVIHRDLPCSPCLKSECPDGTYKCLSLISAEEVIELALEIFTHRISPR
jgi:heptosyltransferase II